MAPPELVTCFSDTTSGAFAFCGLRGLVRVAMVSRHREGGSDSSRGDGAASVSGMLLVLPDCFASDERLVAALRAVNAVAAAASAATTNGAPASGDPAWTEDEQHRMVDVIERPESVKPMALLNDKAVTTILTILVLRIVLGGQRPLSAALTRFVRVLEAYEGVRNRMLDGLFGDRSVTWGDWRRAATMASVRIMPSFNSKGVLLTNYVAFNVAIERERLARQRHIAGSFLQAPGESAVDFERRLAASIFAVVDFIQLSPETVCYFFFIISLGSFPFRRHAKTCKSSQKMPRKFLRSGLWTISCVPSTASAQSQPTMPRCGRNASPFSRLFASEQAATVRLVTFFIVLYLFRQNSLAIGTWSCCLQRWAPMLPIRSNCSQCSVLQWQNSIVQR